MNSRGLLAFCLTVFFAAAAVAEPVKFLRYPHISNDGKLAFSYHGDIWIADGDGSNPRRLTAHVARDTVPRFSPDGKMIAFDSDRNGNDDVWVVSVDGGQPKQITFSSTGDSVRYWTPDGKGVIISTSRGEGAWGSPLYIAYLDGSLPKPLDMDTGATGMFRQDGKMIAFNRVGFRYWRKNYKGNYNTDIYVQDVATKKITQLTDLDLKNYREHTQDAHPMWGADGMIYFMSEKDDIFNIWRISTEGGEPEQVTRIKSDGVQYPSISPDGKTIVYENEFELWKLSIEGGTPEKISVDLSFDPKDNLIEVIDVNNSADDFTPSADGEFVAVEEHGEIFLVPVDPKTAEKTQVTSSPWRDQVLSFSPDGKHLAYMSDKSHDDEIWLYDVAAKSHRQLTEQESRKGDVTWSPDSKKIAYTADNKIYMVNVSDGAISELAHNPESGFRTIGFSNDGHWMVYSRMNRDMNSEVYLFDLNERKEYNVTDSRFTEFGTTLTADGKHVLFVSDRSGDFQIYKVSLAKLTEDPDDPMVHAKKKAARAQRARGGKPGEQKENGDKKEDEKGDDEKKEGDDAKDDDEKEEGSDDKDADDKDDEEKKEVKPMKLEIDLERIDDRAQRLTSSDSVRGFITSKDTKTIYYNKSNGLYAMSVATGEERKIGDGRFSNLTLTGDGKSFFFREGSNIFRMDTNGRGKKQVNFRFRVMVDIQKEWEQVFEESWRVMKYRFYDPDMHGVDWEAMRKKYKPLLKYVGENQDLYDLCNEMIGELNASHTGVNGPPTRRMENLYSTQHLGFEMRRKGEYYYVSRVYRHGPADKEWLDLNVGDIVLSIEGEKIRAGDNYYKILSHLLNDYVDLTVCSPGESSDESSVVLGPERELRIDATGSVRNLKYEEWVEKNRELVDEMSKGKIGYVHIRSMNGSSLRRFEQEINQFWNKNGMVIDIRYNGGGNIDQQLIDILERKPYEYWNTRGSGKGFGRRPRQAIAGPKVMLINKRSGSDSEVTPQAFRDLKLGRIVGNPTYGAVIATGSYRLMNGGSIRTPGALVVTYDPSKENNYGINLENFGVAPDVWVENSPQDELDNNDRELKTAVEEALKMLKEGDWQFDEDK